MTEDPTIEDVVAYMAEQIRQLSPCGYDIRPISYFVTDEDELVGSVATDPADADEWTVYAKLKDGDVVELWDFETPAEAAAALAEALGEE